MEEIKENQPSAPGDKNLALITHLSGIFFGFLVPLIIFLVKKDELDEWTLNHVKEALNFQITLGIAVIACMILMIVVIGAFLLPIVAILGLVFMIIATIKASNGEAYKYPMSIRLIK